MYKTKNLIKFVFTLILTLILTSTLTKLNTTSQQHTNTLLTTYLSNSTSLRSGFPGFLKPVKATLGVPTYYLSDHGLFLSFSPTLDIPAIPPSTILDTPASTPPDVPALATQDMLEKPVDKFPTSLDLPSLPTTLDAPATTMLDVPALPPTTLVTPANPTYLTCSDNVIPPHLLTNLLPFGS
jgi:hypothetical protein